MTNFITTDSTLDPAAIRNRGFASRIFPEFPSEEEIALIADRIGAGELEFWAHEFGQPPRHFESQPVGLMLDALFENSPYSLLIGFSSRNLFIWAPEDHEYLVVFGEPEIVGLVEQSAIFDYGFSDYLASGDLSESTIEHLRELATNYTFG
jgi:hypothetical protein